MDINGVVNLILPIVFSLVGVALIVLLVELIKMMKVARQKVEDLGPTLKNVEEMTESVKPAVAKIDPLMDRVQLTMDSVNLEIMRVDKILEDVGEISNTAVSATAAVDNITNAPLKAVSNVAERVRNAFGGRGASQESEQLAEQRVAVARALEDYREAEKREASQAKKGKREQKPQNAPAQMGSYEEATADTEPVIDPDALADSPFFDDGVDTK